MTTRREFLALTTAVLATRSLGLSAATAATPRDVLVLGGTGFIGPYQVEGLLARGHRVTIFNRGRRPGLYGDRVEELTGDRDPAVGAGLSALAGDRRWDTVIDNSGYYPRHVRASAELLRGRVGRYLFISTVAVYDFDRGPRFTEDGPLAPMPDPENETMAGGRYGPLKAECDRIVRAVYGDDSTVVRPPYIVGPGDHTDRFTYWVDRVHRGGDMLAPTRPELELQWIDVRDLCEWVVTLVERDGPGVFNAAGPSSAMSRAGLLWGIRATSPGPVEFHWATPEVLSALEIQLPLVSRDFPLRFENQAAISNGLSFRPLAETVVDTREWWQAQPADRRASPRRWPTAEQEQAALERLRASA